MAVKSSKILQLMHVYGLKGNHRDGKSERGQKQGFRYYTSDFRELTYLDLQKRWLGGTLTRRMFIYLSENPPPHPEL